MSLSYSSMASSLQPKLVKAQKNLNCCLDAFNKGYAVNNKAFCDAHLRRCISYIKMSLRLLDKNSVDLNNLDTSTYKKTNVAIDLRVDEKSFITGMNYLYQVQSFIGEWENILDMFYSVNEKDNIFAENSVIKSLYYDLKKVYQMFVFDFNDIISVAENARSYIVKNNNEFSYIGSLEYERPKIESIHKGKLTLSDAKSIERPGDKKAIIKEDELGGSGLDWVEYLEAEIEKIESLDANEITESNVEYYATVKTAWCNSKLAEYNISIPDFSVFDELISCGTMSFEEAKELLLIKCSNETKKLENSTFIDETSYLEQENEILEWYKTYYKLLSVNSTGEEKASYDNLFAVLDEKITSNEAYISSVNNGTEIDALIADDEKRLDNFEEDSYAYWSTLEAIADKKIRYYESKKDILTGYELDVLASLKSEKILLHYKADNVLLLERIKENKVSNSGVYQSLHWSSLWLESYYNSLLERCDSSSDEYKKNEALLKETKKKTEAYYDLQEYYYILENPKHYLDAATEYNILKCIAEKKQIVELDLTPEELGMLDKTYTMEDYKRDFKKVGWSSFGFGLLNIGENLLDAAIILGSLNVFTLGEYMFTGNSKMLEFAAVDLTAEGYNKVTEDIPNISTLNNLHSIAYSAGTFTSSLGITFITSFCPVLQPFVIAGMTGGATFESAIANGASKEWAAVAALVSTFATYGCVNLTTSSMTQAMQASTLKAALSYSLEAGFYAASAPLIGGGAEYLAVGLSTGDFDKTIFEYFDDNNIFGVALLSGLAVNGVSFSKALFMNSNSSLYYRKLFEFAKVPEADLIKYGNLSSKEILQMQAFASTGRDKAIVQLARVLDSFVNHTLNTISSTSFCIVFGGVDPGLAQLPFLEKIVEVSDKIKSGVSNVEDFLKKYDVVNSEFLPVADAYLSDDFILKYYQTLFPSNPNIFGAKDLLSLANVLSEVVKEDFITFQNFAPSSSSSGSSDGSGSSVTISVSWLNAHANEYKNCYAIENGKLTILDYAKFAISVLGDVSFAESEDIYMIKSTVPLNGDNIRIPSLLDDTADITSMLPFTIVENADNSKTEVIYPFVSLTNFDIKSGQLGSSFVDSETGITYKVQHVSNVSGGSVTTDFDITSSNSDNTSIQSTKSGGGRTLDTTVQAF